MVPASEYFHGPIESMRDLEALVVEDDLFKPNPRFNDEFDVIRAATLSTADIPRGRNCGRCSIT